MRGMKLNQPLTVNQKNFSVTLPEVEKPWELQQPPTEHVVYAAVSTNRQVHISAFPFKKPPMRLQRQMAFAEMYRIRAEAEASLGGGGGLTDNKTSFLDPLWSAQYVRLHPDADRLAFCRMLCNPDAILVLYFEAFQTTRLQFDQEIKLLESTLAIKGGTT